MAPTIALVITDKVYAEMLVEVLDTEGYAAVCCLSGASAPDLIRREQPALIVLDLWLEHPKAGEMVLALLHLDPVTRHIPVLVCPEDSRSLQDLAARTKNVPYAILQKPFDLYEFVETVRRLTSENSRANEQLNLAPPVTPNVHVHSHGRQP